eukprot:g2594.t1
MLASVFLATVATATATTVATKPSVLFIAVDDLGSNDMGFMQAVVNKQPGGAVVHTPNTDKLASEGLLFTKYYVETVCSPTRSTFQSGRYPIHNTINDYIHPDWAYGLPLNETTVADLLTQEGYTTHAIGKWHLGYHKWAYTPTFRGFSSYFGYYEGAEDYFSHKRSGAYDLHLEEGFRCGPNCSKVPDRTGAYSVNIFSDEAIRRITEHDKSKGPWYIYLAYQSVHSPLQAPDKYKQLYPWLGKRQTVAGMLTCLDEGIGNVTKAMAQAGYDETNSVIIFTAD